MPFSWSALAAALATALALPAGATHTIALQKGIGGVTLGMSQGAVHRKLGRPDRERRGQNQFGLWTELVYPNLRVFFQGDEVATSITTTSAREHTPRGAGVGSTEQQVRARVRGVRCRAAGGARHCFLGSFRPGGRVTDFLFAGSRVGAVTVGVVLD